MALLGVLAVLVVSCTAGSARDTRDGPDSGLDVPSAAPPDPVPVEPIRSLDACSLLPAKSFRAIAPNALLAVASKGYGSCTLSINGSARFHVSASTRWLLDNPKQDITVDVQWGRTRHVDGFTVYPGTFNEGSYLRFVMLGSHHSVLVTARSATHAKQTGKVADAAVHGAVTAIADGTIKHLHWHTGSPAQLADLCDVADTAVHDVLGTNIELQQQRQMFECRWKASSGSADTGDPRQHHAERAVSVKLLAGTIPPNPPGSILTRPPAPPPDRIAGHAADCPDRHPKAQQVYPGGSGCYVDFGPSLFSGKRVVISVRFVDPGKKNPTSTGTRLATAVVTAIDRHR